VTCEPCSCAMCWVLGLQDLAADKAAEVDSAVLQSQELRCSNVRFQGLGV
jgi:hypothetical protein